MTPKSHFTLSTTPTIFGPKLKQKGVAYAQVFKVVHELVLLTVTVLPCPVAKSFAFSFLHFDN